MGGWLPVSRDAARLGIQASGPARSARTRLDCQNSSHIKTCSSWMARKAAAAADSPPQGCNQFIARELFVALDTVKKHVTHVLGKLGAANRTEAAARARQLGPDPLTPHPGRPGSTFG